VKSYDIIGLYQIKEVYYMSSEELSISKDEIYKNIRESIVNAQTKVYSVVNFAMVQAYWEIGKEIYEACGENDRAEYGKNLLAEISKLLTKEFGKGFTIANLKNMRQFYRVFQNRQTLSSELSWSHYNLLMRIEDEKSRKFYIEECIKSSWSFRQLKRQITTSFYERLLSSPDKDKEEISKEIQKLEPKLKPQDIIRDPYVLEFLGLEGNTKFYEKDLEQALIDHLQKFLLELGRGFAFDSRQKRITFDGRHFYIDLVFYNYILKCFVIIDLKLRRFNTSRFRANANVCKLLYS